MKVCLIANQIASWGKIGGFGTATRALGRVLNAHGVEVVAVVPRRADAGQDRIEQLDGITVYGMSIRETFFSDRIFREVDADVYHSQEPTIASWHAQRAMPGAVHVVTCRDPRSLKDQLIELRHSTMKRRVIAPATWLYEAGPPVKRSVRRANAVLMPSPSYLASRIKRRYGGDIEPQFVPSPVELPEGTPQKSSRPLVLFVGRWDRRKRVERFFELARQNPDVSFIAVGRSHHKRHDVRLRSRYRSLPNLEMPGFLPRFGDATLARLYEKAWILVNTSAREGLPYTFLEAAAQDCAILSGLDPEGFASRFGYHVVSDTQDEFTEGLRRLLEADEWRRLGREAGEYVRATFSEAESLRRHLDCYRSMLDR